MYKNEQYEVISNNGRFERISCRSQRITNENVLEGVWKEITELSGFCSMIRFIYEGLQKKEIGECYNALHG